MVGEPTVQDTVSILRGIKDRYEVHHGVRITDGALVAAANLSNRYINERFLPDKAIDLVDEAGKAPKFFVVFNNYLANSRQHLRKDCNTKASLTSFRSLTIKS